MLFNRYGNYNLLLKGIECCENEKSINLNIMKYNFFLKMFKVNFVFNIKLCLEIRKKILILFNEVLGNEEEELSEIIVDDLLKLYTSKEDREIKGLKVIQMKEFSDKYVNNTFKNIK